MVDLFSSLHSIDWWVVWVFREYIFCTKVASAWPNPYPLNKLLYKLIFLPV